MYVDTEYLALEWLSENSETSQRQLSKILGISLGSVNVMLVKMQKEGFIKVKNISHNRVLYMLTPEGIAEKANKTIRYMVRNYRYINDMKERVKGYLKNKLESESRIYLHVDDSEISQIVLLAVSEMGDWDKHRLVIIKELPEGVGDGLVLMAERRDGVTCDGVRTEVIWEKI